MSTLKTLELLHEYDTPESVVTQYLELSTAANDARDEKKQEKEALKKDKQVYKETKADIKSNAEATSENKTAIRDTKKELHDYKTRGDKSKKKSLRSKLSSLVKRKTSLKKQKNTLKEKKSTTKKTITGRRSTIKSLKEKIKTAKEKFEQATKSIQSQVKTLQVLKQIKQLIKDAPADKRSSSEYMALAAFYNDNKDKKISLDSPLEAPPATIQALVSNELRDIRKEKVERTISGINRTFRGMLHGSGLLLTAFAEKFKKSSKPKELPEPEGR